MTRLNILDISMCIEIVSALTCLIVYHNRFDEMTPVVWLIITAIAIFITIIALYITPSSKLHNKITFKKHK